MDGIGEVRTLLLYCSMPIFLVSMALEGHCFCFPPLAQCFAGTCVGLYLEQFITFYYDSFLIEKAS
jgi:hypothetical protein